MSAPANSTTPAAAPARGGILHSFRALRKRDFAIFWTGAFITNAGAWFQSLGVPYVLLMLTDSALWVGLAAAAQFVPVMLLGPLGGQIASAGRLKRTLIITQGLRSLAALALFACWATGVREPLVFLLLAAAAGCAQGISMPSWQAFVHNLSDRQDLASAVTLNTLQFNLSRSFGPAIGGLVLLAWGPSMAFLLAFVAVLCVVVALALVRQSGGAAAARAGAAGRPGVTRGFMEAARYSWGQPGILLALVLVVCVGVLGMPVFQHVIIFAEMVFGSGETGLTLLNLGLGLGTLLAAPVVAGFEHKLGRARLARWAVPLYGLAFMGFAVAPGTISAALALLVVGGAFLAAISVGNTSVQMLVEDGFRGRVLALNVMVYTGSVALGAYLQGWLSDLIGPRLTPLLAGGVLLVAGIVLACWRGKYSLSALEDRRPANVPDAAPENA
ncbi:MFS transporter [Arthrobacter ginkgonis]|uniref:MFS transporter n=1 Tax=Arthrobacter ginkgonis TaxID=1630594 RepID=A0ABP7DBJ4_9MICC